MTHKIDPFSHILNIVVPGDILSTNVDSLRSQLHDLIERPQVKPWEWHQVCLDLAHAQMVDSMGLNLIVSLVRLLQNRGVRLQVKVASPNIHRTFLFTRLDKQLEIVSA